jgi:plasmid stability protein
MHVGCKLDPIMAKTIQIRDVPEDVHRTLRVRAAAAGRSLSDYLLDELVRVAERPPVVDVLRQASMRTGGVPLKTIVAAVRSGRDRRSS